jgi:hypothetical protein
MAIKDTHAAANGAGTQTLCGAKVPRACIRVGGAFNGKVSCKKCRELHQKITGKVAAPAKADPWAILNQLIMAYAEAAIADSRKGGGDPADFEVIELREKLARAELASHLEVMRRKYDPVA